MKLKVKVNDLVQIITGKDKGRTGKIKKIMQNEEARGRMRVRVLVERCNMVKKHTRANPDQNKPGGILKQEAPIDISNVKVIQEVVK
ncbi:MAG: 50S ribosomal protein L24 [Legionellales bacterium]|nr:MAG: 50S ribosomal protein L24 [Legionellales bacterium]